ncbi:unnamed protein product [Camellia sinensis]
MESLTELLADGTTIKQLPFSIGLLKNLKSLSSKGCNRQFTTKSWLSLISSQLDLSECNLSKGDFPINLESLSSLQVLYLEGNNFCSLPYDFSYLSKLEVLGLSYYTSLQSISNLPLNLLEVYATDCASLEKIYDLSKLKTLELWLPNTPFEHKLSNLEMWLGNAPFHHKLSNHKNQMEELHCFQGARIIPLDKLNKNSTIYQISLRVFFDILRNASGARGRLRCRFSLGVVYYTAGDECSMELDDFLYAIISDKINGIDLTYTPTFFGIPGSCGDYIWISHIEIEEYFGYQIKGSEQFEVSFIMTRPLKLKKCGIDLIIQCDGGCTKNYCELRWCDMVWELSPLRNLIQWAHNQEFKEWFWQVMTHGGEVMVAMSEQLPFWVDANCAKAFAAAKAIALARDLGFCDIILEGDSLNIVHALREGGELLSEDGHILDSGGEVDCFGSFKQSM